MQTRVARYHNIFGPEGTWRGGKEKAPAAIARKVAEAPFNGSMEIWGDGEQNTVNYYYIDECIEGTLRLTRSSFEGPVNIGSDEMVSINKLASIIMGIANKSLRINHIPGPLGVRGRNSHNELIYKKLGWCPSLPLKVGLALLYPWVEEQVAKARGSSIASLERMVA